jgi:hypothetical protein
MDKQETYARNRRVWKALVPDPVAAQAKAIAKPLNLSGRGLGIEPDKHGFWRYKKGTEKAGQFAARPIAKKRPRT